jgi:4-carboxymuconolactone decarboxylase
VGHQGGAHDRGEPRQAGAPVTVTPRFEPRTAVEIDAWAAAQDLPPQFRDAGFPTNLVALGLNNEGLFSAYATVARYISTRLAIPARTRELLIIRCAVKVGSAYEWEHHVRIGRGAGLTDSDLEALASAEPSTSLTPADAGLVRACDQLIDDAQLSESTFRELSADFTTSELMEIISVVGTYYWTAMLLRSFQVPVEDAAGD